MVGTRYLRAVTPSHHMWHANDLQMTPPNDLRGGTHRRRWFGYPDLNVLRIFRIRIYDLNTFMFDLTPNFACINFEFFWSKRLHFFLIFEFNPFNHIYLFLFTYFTPSILHPPPPPRPPRSIFFKYVFYFIPFIMMNGLSLNSFSSTRSRTYIWIQTK